MTFKNIVDDALERCNYDQTQTSSIPRTRFGRYVNQWHRRLLSKPGMERLRDDIGTFATVGSQQRYALPLAIDRIRAMYEPTTYQVRLVERSMDWLRERPTTTVTGIPQAWIPMGYTQVATQPVSTGLWIASSDAADTTQKVYVEGARTGASGLDPVVGAGTTLNGTARVRIGTLSDWVEVDKFFLDGACAGAVSLFNAVTLGTTLATIPIGQTAARYWTVMLWPNPSAVMTMYVDYSRALTDMAQSNDVPFLPDDFHWMLSLAARRDEYEYKKDYLALKAADADLQRAGVDLLDFVCNNPDYLIIPGEEPPAFSNIGPYFPPGTW